MSDTSDQCSRDMSRTLLGGSEEDYEAICDPCYFEKQHIEAKAYCSNCNENLCTACIKVHRKMAGLRDHVIETEVRSQSRKVKAGRPMPSIDTDPLDDRCQEHQQEVVKFFCNTHQTLGCGVCLPFDHKNCTDMSYIGDVSGKIANSDELKNVRTELRQVAARLRFSKTSIDCTKERIAQRYNQTLEEIDNFQDEINNYVHEVADDARQEATRLRDEALKESDGQATACKERLQETEQMTTDMDTKSKSGLNNGLYVAMKRANAKLPDLQKETTQVSEKAPSRFVFKREEKLLDILSSRVRLGKVTMTTAPRVAEYVQDVTVSSDRDTEQPSITGIAAVSGGRLAIIDNKNKALKVVHVKQRKVIDRIPTSSLPLGITEFEEDTVAVTQRGERIIQVFSLAPVLAMHRAIKVNHLYAGIVYGSGRFAMTVQAKEPDRTIHMCDASGQLIMKVEQTTMQGPLGITFNPTQDVMYVGDMERNAVVCFDISGEFISTYTHSGLKAPAGIAVDEDGFAYVCSRHSHCIHRMIPGAGSGEPILKEKHLIAFPLAMAYSRDHIFISSNSTDPKFSNCIKIFKLN